MYSEYRLCLALVGQEIYIHTYICIHTYIHLLWAFIVPQVHQKSLSDDELRILPPPLRDCVSKSQCSILMSQGSHEGIKIKSILSHLFLPSPGVRRTASLVHRAVDPRKQICHDIDVKIWRTIDHDGLSVSHNILHDVLPVSHNILHDGLSVSHNILHDVLPVSHNITHDLLPASHNILHDVLPVSHNITHDVLSASHNILHDVLSVSHNIFHDVLPVSHNIFHDVLPVSHNITHDCYYYSLTISHRYC